MRPIFFAGNIGGLRPLNQLQPIAGRINRDADDNAAVSEWSRLTGHRSSCGFDCRYRRGHVLHVENDVRDRILQVVGVAMHITIGSALFAFAASTDAPKFTKISGPPCPSSRLTSC